MNVMYDIEHQIRYVFIVASIQFFYGHANTKKKFACNRSEKFIFNTRCSDVCMAQHGALRSPHPSRHCFAVDCKCAVHLNEFSHGLS